MLLAALTAWVAPLVLGLLIMALLSPLRNDAGDDIVSGLLVLAVFSLYSVMFSWVGIIPGALGHLLVQRAGYGGWLTCLGVALLLGIIINGFFGPLAIVFGLPVAMIYWVALRAYDPAWLLFADQVEDDGEGPSAPTTGA
jgi:hypothetical protein